MTATYDKPYDSTQSTGESDSRAKTGSFARRPWAEVDKERKDNPHAIAIKELTSELQEKWTKARIDSGLDLEKDLGMDTTSMKKQDPTAGWEEMTFIGAWAQSLVGQSLEEHRIVYLTSVSEMLKLRESGQVPSKEIPMFHFDRDEGKYISDSPTHVENIGQEMIEHQHDWWLRHRVASHGTMFDMASKFADCDDEFDEETLRSEA